MTLHELNSLPRQQLSEILMACCGSASWVKKMVSLFPADDIKTLLKNAEEQWWFCSEEDWREAFAHHPKIGNPESAGIKDAISITWARNEQAGIKGATHQTIELLTDCNYGYEKKFGYIFIVCATGRSAEEMLNALQARLKNNPAKEIGIAAAEQNKITKLRLQKLLE